MGFDVKISWEGDSLEILKGFPKDIKLNIGLELRRLQQNLKPHFSRPMKSIGARIYEIKDSDERTWYRVIFLAKVEDTIFILHAFEKKSRKTSQKDLDKALMRLKRVRERLRDEKKNNK